MQRLNGLGDSVCVVKSGDMGRVSLVLQNMLQGRHVADIVRMLVRGDGPVGVRECDVMDR